MTIFWYGKMKIYKRKKNKKTIAGSVYHLLYYDTSFIKILYHFLFVVGILASIYFIYTRFLLLVIVGAVMLFKIIPGYYRFIKMVKEGLFDNKTLYGEMSKFLFKNMEAYNERNKN